MSLFGIDIAGILNDAMTRAGGLTPGVLTRKTVTQPTAVNPGGGGTVKTETHAFQGALESGERRVSGLRQTVQGEFLTIMGASLEVEPRTNDAVEIEGRQLTLAQLVERDPASAAYTFRVEG